MGCGDRHAAAVTDGTRVDEPSGRMIEGEGKP
jgi:hypothetical protein